MSENVNNKIYISVKDRYVVIYAIEYLVRR